MTTYSSPRAIVDADDRTVTVAVTIQVRRPWAVDACEMSVLAGEAHRALARHFADYDQVEAITTDTFDPSEERRHHASTRLAFSCEQLVTWQHNGQTFTSSCGERSHTRLCARHEATA